MKATHASNQTVPQLDETPPRRITVHVYKIERHDLPRVVVVTQRRHSLKKLLKGGVIIERANGESIVLEEGSVSRVDHEAREATLDAIN